MVKSIIYEVSLLHILLSHSPLDPNIFLVTLFSNIFNSRTFLNVELLLSFQSKPALIFLAFSKDILAACILWIFYKYTYNKTTSRCTNHNIFETPCMVRKQHKFKTTSQDINVTRLEFYRKEWFLQSIFTSNTSSLHEVKFRY